jgi:transcriptional regulator GlxA family with amidase domain
MKALLAARATRIKSIGILGFDGVSILDLSGPLEALVAARTDVDADKVRACYDARIIAVNAKTFVSASNVAFLAKETLLKASDLDTVIIPGGLGMREGETGRKVSEWLGAHAAELNRIVSISSGIYPLAQSGLLDGRKVATHWKYAQDVARRFPKLRVDSTASFLKDGPFYTCGGGTAATELTLALIEEDYGSRVALSVARELCVRLRPLGDHANALDPAQFECGPNDRLAELPAWIAAHLNHDLSVEILADRACLCPRHFSRLFKRAFRSSPANFVETLRIDEARRQLLLARVSVEGVAAAVGFKDADSFRRAFERRVGVNPATFRRQRFAVVVDTDKTASSRDSSKISVLPRKALGRHKSVNGSSSLRLRGARASRAEVSS